MHLHFVQFKDYYLYWLIPTCAEINQWKYSDLETEICADNFHEMALCYEMLMNCPSLCELYMLSYKLFCYWSVHSRNMKPCSCCMCAHSLKQRFTWATFRQNLVSLLIVVGSFHCQGFVFVSSCVYTVIFVSRWPICSSDFGSYSNWKKMFPCLY